MILSRLNLTEFNRVFSNPIIKQNTSQTYFRKIILGENHFIVGKLLPSEQYFITVEYIASEGVETF